MGKSNYSETAFLTDLYDSGTAISSLGASLWASLYTSDPGEAGTAVTNETAYTGYARVAVSRTTGFTVASGVATLAANVTFGECTASPGAALTHFAIVDSASGAGNIWHSGTLTPNITMAVGVSPVLKSGSTITEE